MKPQAYIQSHQPKGFTLPELMITLTVAAILAGIAAPSFSGFIISERIRTASFDLIAQLTLARSEAIKRNSNVTLTSTSGTDAWSSGWTIATVSGGVTDTIKTQQSYSNISITSSGSATQVVYNRNGRVSSPASIQFQIADAAQGVNSRSRCVSMGVTGQPSSKKGSC